MNKRVKAYLVGGGIGSLAAAAFMIRDGGVLGADISILEASPVPGGSLDAAGSPDSGYSMRGGRMFTTDNYECTWDLFKSIPSLNSKNKTVFDETVEFNEKYQANSMARLVDRCCSKVPVGSMGFSMQNRMELLKLSNAEEGELGNDRITDWLSPTFFDTEFWYMWSTTFAFQPWHSAVEFKRYLHRFMLEFARIDTLAGVKRTIYNQYDSLVRPLQSWLEGQGVHFVADCLVTDFDSTSTNGMFSVTGIHCRRDGKSEFIEVLNDDFVFFQNASMTDASSLGSMTTAPEKLSKKDSGGWALWEKLAKDRPEFGSPAVFSSCIAQSFWESFTVTLKHPMFFDQMLQFTGNVPGTGGLVTFKDSNWLMSIVLPHQPHFQNQPHDVQVFWGYALHPDRIGNFVAKPMSDCNGAEILRELCGHLGFDLETVESAICIPSKMPYITSMFMPRTRGDRPLPKPLGSRNLAFISQFVEIPDEVVFTVEYSIRAAQIAVYQLLRLDRQIPVIQPHDKSIRTQLEALIKAFK
ncbi:oleate hydratase [Collimonas sp. NPDC087041]|uniref:oleate hydratase n=1 Tax=Collimonas sp. NPDC087041 TaxID=3363960 RepID=UPI003826C10D